MASPLRAAGTDCVLGITVAPSAWRQRGEREWVARWGRLAYARTVSWRVHRMSRTLVCLLAICAAAAMLAASPAVLAAKAPATTGGTGATTGGTNLLESGGAGTSSGEGSEE